MKKKCFSPIDMLLILSEKESRKDILYSPQNLIHNKFDMYFYKDSAFLIKNVLKIKKKTEMYYHIIY